MAFFKIPTFNLTVNIWRWSSVYTNPPDVVVQGNLSPGKRTMTSPLFITLPLGPTHQLALGMPMELLMPKGTDVRPWFVGVTATDLIECPAGTGRYYVVVSVDDVGKGFSNEYRIAILLPFGAALGGYFTAAAWGGPPDWPAPIP